MIYNCIQIFKRSPLIITAIGEGASYGVIFPDRTRLKLAYHNAFSNLILPDDDGVDARLHTPRDGVSYLYLRIPITNPLFNACILNLIQYHNPDRRGVINSTINHCIVHSKYSEKYLDKLQS